MEISPAAPPPWEGGSGVDASAASAAAAAPPSSSPDPDSGSRPEQPASAPEHARRLKYDEEEEEEDVCRICRNPGDADNPLRYPCACSGSIKFVHQDCLLQWLDHSNARQCEVCKHAFSFSPVYAENAPARLPFQEFLVGMAMKACHVLQFFLRLTFVLSVWLLIIPFITFWIWRLAFVRSFTEAQRLFLSHLSTTVILTDCLHGFLLSASIVFIFLGATSLRDYFRHLRELGGQDAERDDEGDRNGARAARRPVAPPNRNLAGEANGEEANGAQGIAGAGHVIRRNAENVAARWEMQAARLEAHVEQMFDGLDDGDGAEDVPFDELVGMQGPVFHLVENAFTVLASNMIFLGVIIFVPFSLGRVTLYYLSWLLANGPVLSKVMPLTESALSLANITLKNALTAATNLSSEGQSERLVGQVAEVLSANTSGLNEISSNISSNLSGDFLKAAPIGTSRLSDVTTLAIGYLVIFSAVLCYLGIVLLIRYTKGEPLTNRRFYGIASIAETIPSLLRQFLAAMRHLMTMIKVAFLLVIELGVFPLMCGWWLDVCTIRMFGKSMSNRVQFFSLSPLASSLVHWVVGIVYMLQISIFVSLLRGVLRNGVLYFLRDPADPNYNPFRDLIDDPVHKHARRVLLSVAVYGSLIVMLVFLPVKLAMRIAPSIFPLDISVSDPFTEIPADMLLFQICIPFAIEHFKLRSTIRSLLHYWFTAVGWALGLTDFLLPRPDDNGTQETVNGEPARQDRLQVVPLGGHDRAMAVANDSNGSSNVFQNSDVVEEYDSDEQSDSDRYSFVLRIVLLLMVAWMTLLIFNSALIIVPVSLGRKLFNAIPLLPITHGIKCNDLYAFIIGSYVIWTGIAGVRYTLEHIRSRRAAILMGQIWRCSCIVIKSSALLSLWIFVIPVLIGLLFELLVIVPMRVPTDESPVFLLYQDWALGLIFLKIWTRLVMLDHMMPFVDESWRLKFERVREDGFSRLQGLWVLREIVLPIMMKLLTALCVPYVLARGVFPVFGYPLVVNSAVYRFAWLGCLGLSILCFCAKRFHVWFTNLHNAIRDDRYLIGRRLHNFGEDNEVKKQNEAEAETTADSPTAGTGLVRLDREVDVGLRLRHVN
ncbi:RING-CH-type domain-containing protein [Psidium guajava]|nr:RING-CH-type domain-containing protein [Psidium guajava]